ncbi:MAG TPA: patatin-like phospholipase family protein [Caulobacteraceae bacterium]|nr:patatin-like phospholipase family protein [Caulobacteraceae bacterium]
MTTGIVLSGGGALGDFEIGALRAMYNRGIRPDVLTGTSVGSINAVKLAEDPKSDGPLTELEGIWFGLNNNADMFVEDPNFALIDQSLKDFLHYTWFTIGWDLFTIATSGLVGILADLGDALGVGLIKTGVDITNLLEGVNAYLSSGSKSLYLLDPIRQKLTVKLLPDKVAKSGAILRMATVSLESGLVRYIDQNGRFIDDGTQVDLIQGVMASASIPAIFPPQRIGNENFVDGGIRDVLPIQAALDAGADQVFAVAASRSGVDPKPQGFFNDKTILDIAQRGAGDIMSSQVMSLETNPLVQPWPDSVLIIQPDFSVHDAFTIDPGLIRINSGYGYMRAAELVDFSAAAQAGNLGAELTLIFLAILSTAIARLRHEIWLAEFGAAGQRTPQQQVSDPQLILVPSPELFLFVRESKAQLKILLEDRLSLYGTSPRIGVSQTALNFGSTPVCAQATLFIEVRNLADAGMPPDISALWLQFEAHPFVNPAAASPWSLFVSAAGTVPAATPPPPTITLDDLQFAVSVSPGLFSVTTTATDVPAGQSATIAVTMGPPPGSPLPPLGPAEATLTITSNDPNTPTITVSLIGEFVASPPRLVAPPSVNFGVVLVDQTRRGGILIRNTGCGDLTVTALNLTDPFGVFDVSGPPMPFSLPNGGATHILLAFSPLGDRAYTGSLSIVTNAQTATVALKGVGRGRLNLPTPGVGTPSSLARVLAASRNAARRAPAAPKVTPDSRPE